MDLVSALIKDRGELGCSANTAAAMLAFNTNHFGDLTASQEQQLQQKLRLQHQQQQHHHQQQQQQRERLHSDDNTNNNNHQQQQQLLLNQQQQQQQQQQVRTHAHLQQIRQAIQLQQLQNQHNQHSQHSQHQYQHSQQHSTSQQQQQQQQHQQQQQQQQQHYATSSSPLQGTVANMPDSPNTPGSSCAKEEVKSDEWQPYPESAFLGPTLWDKTLPYESQTPIKQSTGCKQRPEVKLSELHDSRGSNSIPSPSPPTSPNPRPFSDAMLEYMDLDDFLDENNLHLNNNGDNNSSSNHNNNNSNSSTGGASVESSSTATEARSPLQAESPSSPDATSAIMGTGLGACMGGAMGAQMPPAQNMGLCSPPVMSPNDLISPLSPGSPPDHSMINNEYHSKYPHPEHGHRGNFDPRTHQFSEDELKPHAIVKKSRKQFVPSDLKDDRYWDRRYKNNAAAKRSRDARRMKENQIAMRASFLEKENQALTLEIEQANAIVENLKKRLSVYEAV